MAKRRNRSRRQPVYTGEVVKASFPAGSIVQTAQQIAGPAASQGRFAPFDPQAPRDPQQALVPFAPGTPLLPGPINFPAPGERRPQPRRYEFETGWNLQVTEQKLVPFHILRQAADNCDLARRCIEVVKSSIAGMEWDISLSPAAVQRIVSESGADHVAAAREARQKLMPDITRAKDFWAEPDRLNGMSFPEWIGCVLEEVLVIDALSIYPNFTFSGDFHSLEILDGSTIKPLLNERGSRPVAPQPAFQQVLYGFPRGEFTYNPGDDSDYTADDLIYAPRNRRTWTPYGFSNIERALPLIDIYLKRQHWIRSEFTEGVVPELMIKTDANYGGNPDLLRAYEAIFNDSLAGLTENRKRARLLPEGMDPVQLRNWAEKYRPDFDEQLVKDLCGHFGVLPSQIGYTPRGSLGGSGHQQGEAANLESIGLKPVVAWLVELLNKMSYKFLGISPDLSFTFLGSRTEEEISKARLRQVELFSGQRTLNEIRSHLGLPLFEFDEADMPFIAVGSALTFLEDSTTAAPPLNPDGSELHRENGGLPDGSERADADHEAENNNPAPGGEGGNHATPVRFPSRGVHINGTTSTPKSPRATELKAFRTWIGKRKTGASRQFNFIHLSSDEAECLNALAATDSAAALDYASILER